MIRAADFIPLAPRPLTPAPLAKSGAASAQASSWFDGDAYGAAARIGADLTPQGRGLGVAEHVARVLGHLCAAPDERA